MNNKKQTVLVLQGGGALGAYQGGAYDGLIKHGLNVDWVVGTSIGAINGALIAGNKPEHRVERLNAFWREVGQDAPAIFPFFSTPDWMRPWSQATQVWNILSKGVPGFFIPRQNTSWTLIKAASRRRRASTTPAR